MAKSLFLHVRGFWSDRRGTVAVITAVALTAMLGVAGLGTEATMWYVAKRDMQGAADAAAYTAASAEAAGQNSTNFTLAGQAVTAQWGFTNGSDQVAVAVNNPPLSGNYTSNGQAIEVVVTQPQQMLFAQWFMASAPNVSARAVAVPASSGGSCVMALDGSGTTPGLVASAGGTINLTGCSLDVNASGSGTNAVNLSGGSQINVQSANIVGTYTPSGGAAINATDTLTTGGSAKSDPYSSLNIPSTNGYCTKSTGGTTNSASGVSMLAGSLTLTPPAGGVCTIDGAVSISGGTLNLQPGVYIVDGNFGLSGAATISGTGGVTIIITHNASGSYGTLNQGGTTSALNITAPSTGTTAGVAIYQDRAAPDSTYTGSACASNCSAFGGTSATQNIEGAIYFPHGSVAYAGHAANAGSNCTQLIAYTMNFSGTMTFNSRCSGTGVLGMSSTGTTELVE
jgi:hypothetical protein